MIRVGIAGIGFMGWIHYLTYEQLRGVKLVAIAEPNAKRLAGDWRDIKGNFGPPGRQVELSGVARYADFHQMLADDQVDLVDICLPPAMHPAAAIAALQAGKHVFCEKPMALKAKDCDRMVAAAAKAGRQLFIGHVLPFFPEYAYAIRQIGTGKYGKLLGGNFKRIISDPLWLPDFFDPDRVGGPLLDLHVHDAHLIRLLFGMPTGLASRGRMRGEVVEYCQTQFQFPDEDLVVSATGGVINQQGREFTHGFEIHLEHATMHYEFAGLKDGAELMPLKILDRRGRVVRPKLGGGDPTNAFLGEIKEVLACLKSGRPSDTLAGNLARDAVTLCHRQTDSVKRGRAVKV